MSFRAGLTASSSRISSSRLSLRSTTLGAVRYNGTGTSMKSVQDVTRAIENMRKTEEDQIKQRKRQASRAKAQGMEVPKNVKLDDIPMPAFEPVTMELVKPTILFKPSKDPKGDSGLKARWTWITELFGKNSESYKTMTIELMCRIETITDMGHPDSALQKLPRSQLTRLDKLKVWVTPSRIVLGKTIKPTLEYARDVYCRYHEAQARGDIAGVDATSARAMRTAGRKIAKTGLSAQWEMVDRESVMPRLLWYRHIPLGQGLPGHVCQLCLEIEATQSLTTTSKESQQPTVRTQRVLDRVVFMHLEPDAGEGLKLIERVKAFEPYWYADAKSKVEQDELQKKLQDRMKKYMDKQ